MRRVGDLRGELDRVRKLAEHRAAARARGMDTAAVGRCERLLAESADLLAEGGELLQRNALKHDVLARSLVGEFPEFKK